MTIVVTTPTGHIGNAVTRRLLDDKQDVTIIARFPDKVKDLKERGAKVIVGSHDDQTVVNQATKRADALFWLTPPDLTSTNVRAHYRKFGEVVTKAIETNDIPYVVHLSSAGSNLSWGTGPILGLHDTEKMLSKTSTNTVQLRSAYFMENTLMQMGNIKKANSLFTTFRGDTRIPMIATQDIAERASQYLINRNFTREKIVELQGHANISYDEIANCLSETLNMQIKHVRVDEQQAKDGMMKMGLSPNVADNLLELEQNLDNGRICFNETRCAENSNATAYPVFARDVFGPLYDKQ